MLDRVRDSLRTVFPKPRPGHTFTHKIIEEFNAADHYIAIGEYGTALKRLDDMIRTVRKDEAHLCAARALMHFRKGVCYRATKNVTAAESSFNCALRNDDLLVEAHIELGLIHLERHEPEGSKKHFDEAARMPTYFFKAFIGSAYVSLEAKQYKRAGELIARARDLDNKSGKPKGMILDIVESEFFEGRGRHYLEQKKYLEAAEDFMMVKKLDRLRGYLMDQLICKAYFCSGVALLLAERGDRAGAKKTFLLLIDRLPNMKGSLINFLRDPEAYGEKLSENVIDQLDQIANEIEWRQGFA